VIQAADTLPSVTDDLRATVAWGGAAKYHQANAAKGKLFARERIAGLIDEGSFVEDGMLANALAGDLPADGVITGTATVDGRRVCLMANDSTVKAGSWGARTVEKIIRIIEAAYRTQVPMVWLVDSAGARITDQVAMFPGRRGAGRIFHSHVRAAGSIPQVCLLFGPSAAAARAGPRHSRDRRRPPARPRPGPTPAEDDRTPAWPGPPRRPRRRPAHRRRPTRAE